MTNARTVANLPNTLGPRTARAWVVFDGKTGSVATIKDSYGITSVVRNGTGDYTITFSTAFANTNYCMVGSCKADSNIGIYVSEHQSVSPTTTTIRVTTWYGYASASQIDSPSINLAFFDN